VFRNPTFRAEGTTSLRICSCFPTNS
jgi:hypothetical protein